MSSNSEDESMDLNESSIESDSQAEGEEDSNEEDANDALEANESETESDDEDQDIAASEDSSDDENDEESEDETENIAAKTKEAKIREEVINRLKGHIGKQLYVRFNARLPEDEAEFQKQAKALSPLITKGIKPRQRHARFCLVEFETQKDRDATFVKLRAASNKKDPALKGIVVSIPRTEDEQFVESLIEKKIKALEKKKAKNRMKKTIKQLKKKKSKIFTSTIVVRDLPGNVSMAEIRSLFPNAVDIQTKQLKANKSSLATITLPTSKDAREAFKQQLSLGGTRLKINFHGSKIKRTKVDNTKKEEEEEQNQTEPKKKIRKVLCE